MIEASDTTDIVFSARRSALEPRLRWRLAEDTLFCERGPAPAATAISAGLRLMLRVLLPWLRTTLDDRWPERIQLSEIASVRLRFDPTRFAPNRYRCDLVGRNGARMSIFSTHYVGPGYFEDREDQYNAFVRNLAYRVQRDRPSVKLTTGLSWPSYLLQHGVLLAALIALATILGIAGLPIVGATWAKLAIVAAYVGVALRYARVNMPRDLTIPKDLISPVQQDQAAEEARRPPPKDP